MTRQSRITLYLLILIMSFGSCSDNFHPRDTDHPEWSKVYNQYGIDNAGFEVFDNNHERIHYYNLDRISSRRAPASTFKIFIALVALETGIAPDENLVIPWNGEKSDYPKWDKDLDLKEAMLVSSEPYFRELIQRIGRQTMQSFLDSNRYGNMKLGKILEDSWHDGSLLISPDEQVGFIKALYHDQLTFSQRTQRIARRLLTQEDSLARKSGKPYKITYKTGLSVNDSLYDCWQVGYLEDSLNNAHPYFFANNFSVGRDKNMDSVLYLRLQTTRDILGSLNLL